MNSFTSLLLALSLLSATHAWGAPEINFVEIVSASNLGNGKTIELDRLSFDLRENTDLQSLENELLKLLEIGQQQKQAQIDPQAARNFPIGGDIQKALKFSLKLLTKIKQLQSPNETLELRWQLYSVLEAINNNYRYTVKRHLHLHRLPWDLREHFNSKVGKFPHEGAQINWSEASLNSFWQNPGQISSKNIAVGFDRANLPNYQNTVFTYHKAKTGNGTHAGFRVTDDNGQDYKIRIGPETNVGPFSTRILWALGFHTSQIDHLPRLLVKYDRRLLTEYNSRKASSVKLKLLGLPLLNRKNQKHFDPFQDIALAHLKNGQQISGQQLKENLLSNTNYKAETYTRFYNTEFETQIATLEFHNVSIEQRQEEEHSIGPWDWSQEQLHSVAPLRGYALLAAWLGQYDARTENTRLILRKTKDGPELIHAITDVGSGLGGASWALNFKLHNLKKFEDKFLEKHLNNDGNTHVQSWKFRTLSRNETFEAMTEADAQWMLSLILQLTEDQIESALRVSGFNEKEIQGFKSKLISRREHARSLLSLK